MNRSIFQICNFFFGGFKIFFCVLIFSFFIFLLIRLNYSVNCTNLKHSSDFLKYSLKLINFNKKFLLASNSISENDIKKIFEMFAHDYFNNGFKSGISKYFLKINNILVPFSSKSSYSHPNIYLGVFNNNYVNFQLTHNNLYNFNFFTEEDLTGNIRDQFICDYLQIYDGSLSRLAINYNDLNFNNQYSFENNTLINSQISKSSQVQEYLENNSFFINNKIGDYLN